MTYKNAGNAYIGVLIGLLLSLLISSTSHAESGYTLVPNDTLASQHAWDHVGTSFAVNMVMYGVFHNGFKFTRRQSVLLAATTTFIATTMYSLSGSCNSGQLRTDMGWNVIGIGLSAGTVFAFEF